MLARSPEDGSRRLAELPGSSGEDKIELRAVPGPDGGGGLELVQYRWGSGVGWYVQKRMTLDAGQAGALASILGEAAAPGARRPRSVRSVIREENLIRIQFSG